jgi:hypothetical protein
MRYLLFTYIERHVYTGDYVVHSSYTSANSWIFILVYVHIYCSCILPVSIHVPTSSRVILVPRPGCAALCVFSRMPDTHRHTDIQYTFCMFLSLQVLSHHVSLQVLSHHVSLQVKMSKDTWRQSNNSESNICKCVYMIRKLVLVHA